MGIFCTSRPVARGGVTATATMSSVNLSGASFSNRSTFVSDWQKKIATGHASTLHMKVSVPGRLGRGGRVRVGVRVGVIG